MDPLKATLVNCTAPVFPVRLTFQALVIVAPAGNVRPTVQPLIGDAPAVTRIVATKPPFHWLSDTEAEQPVGGGGVVGGGVVGGGVVGGGVVGGGVVGGGVVGGGVGPSVRVGVVQSLHSARLPAFRLEIRKVP